MRFIDKNGKELITIRELFRSKKFIGGINDYYLFYDYITEEKEIWTFVECLAEHIPINTGVETMKTILIHCGWCRKIEIMDIKEADERERLSIKKLISDF